MTTLGSSDENEQGSVPPSSRERDTQIFICDASAEAGRLLTAFHSRGYAIVDVPLGLLPSRVNYEIPTVVICDADGHETRRRLTEMLEAAREPIAIALLGHPKGAMMNDPELRKLAQAMIPRPIDIDTALEKIGLLAGSPARGSHRPRIGLSVRSPVLVAAARKPYRSDRHQSASRREDQRDAAEGGQESLWPTESLPSRGPAPVDSNRFAFDTGGGFRGAIPSSAPPSSHQLELSSETQTILEEGRRRTRTYTQNSPRPIRLAVAPNTGGDEVREEFLAALSEPLGEDAHLNEDDSRDKATASGTQGGRKKVGVPPETASGLSRPGGTTSESRLTARGSAHPAEADEEVPAEERTNPGGRPATQPPPSNDHEDDLLFDEDMPPGLDDLSDLLNTKSSAPPTSLPAISVQTERPLFGGPFDRGRASHLMATIPPPTRPGKPPQAGSSMPPLHLSHPAPAFPTAPRPPQFASPDLTPRVVPAPTHRESTTDGKGALVNLARAIRERRSGAVAQQEGMTLRRIVLFDGDIATVNSSSKEESLAKFLEKRGDLSSEVAAALGSIPGFGRHAGAALIARGLLQQEDLWPVLRAHAEWILGHALLSEEETLFEETVPERILEEPAVFGGAAGTEIYLESLRRVVSPSQAFSLLGPGEQVLGIGAHESLLTESALEPTDQQQLLEAAGKPLTSLHLRRPDLLPLLLGLTYLGVFSTGGEAPPPPVKENVNVRSEEIDDEAFVARVMTRRRLVDDGDYFSILGVSRTATAYEIERARDELLREYSDQRLNARTVHLKQDLKLLRETINEAHLVLRDDVRRLRYRSALEAVPA